MNAVKLFLFLLWFAIRINAQQKSNIVVIMAYNMGLFRYRLLRF